MKKLIYIDASFTYQNIVDRRLDHVLSIRKLQGYWEKVWSVHPLDFQSAESRDRRMYGRPKVESIDKGHLFVRGRYGRYAFLAKFVSLNVMFSLVDLIWLIVRIAKTERIDAVRAGDPLLCGLIGLIVAKIMGTPFVVRVPADHDMLRSKSGKPIQKRLFRRVSIERFFEKLVLQRADAIIAPNKVYMEFVLRRNVDRRKCHVVRYGNLIDPRHVEEPTLRPSLQDASVSALLGQRSWLLYLGRLVEDKRVEDCLHVIHHVRRAGKDVGLFVVGDGPLQDSMRHKAVDLGVGEFVVFLGARDQSFLAQLIPLCAVFLSPLTGRALSEVAFGGLATVAYDLDWQSELMIDGYTGMLVRAGDVMAMARATVHLLENREFAHALGRAARERAIKFLDPLTQSSKEKQVYEDLLA